jgi:predicted negative regulator of RcsB-dependent stress response
MKRIAIVFTIWSILLSQVTRSQTSSVLDEAMKPLSEGVPEVAVARLQASLSKSLSATDWKAVATRLAEALIRADRPIDALRLLDDPRFPESPLSKFWRAQALASLGRPAEALSLFQQANAAGDSSIGAETNFGEAEMLRALNRTQEAIEKYSSLFRDRDWGVRAQLRTAELYLNKLDAANARRILDKLQPSSAGEKKERRFLHGRVEMVLHRPERAIATFETILKRPAGASHSLILAALFGIADAHLQLKTPETGDDVLEDFIDRHPRDVDLGRIFAKLDELYRAEKKPSRTELEAWVHDSAQPRRVFAQWYLARLELRAGHRARAVELFAALRQSDQKPPSLTPALFGFAELEIEDRHFDDALATLNEARTLRPEPELLDRINLLAAQIEYRAGHFDKATATFEQTARSSSRFADISMFNAALAWLQVGDRNRFAADYKELAQKEGGENSQAELRLEAGLLQAAKGDKQATQSLQTFLHDFPQDPRASEAWVALAELAFHASPPRLDEARKFLANISTPTAAAEERRDYLAVWIEDAAGTNEARVMELAKQFLQQHGTSRSASDVRMKLAEVYYRAHDFANARTEFEKLAEQDPTGPWLEKALFFAAESSMSSMGANSTEQALGLFDRVVHLNGELKWPARNEQAAIERKIGKAADAVVLYDEVIKGDARPAEKREALCGKADIFFETGASDPKNYQRAAELYDQLANDREGAVHWRKQALFKKGACLEKTTDRTAALATFYDVLQDQSRPAGTDELFWFYKAGFSAGRLLEDDAKWQSAAAVYEKLAAVGGVRSDEAKQRLDRIRLEHFLWEE